MKKTRRVIERDYLAALTEAVPLETWREICKKAAEQAKQGYSKPREWLARYLLGEERMELLTLAADEYAGHTADAEVERQGKRQAEERQSADRILGL
jgi:hypothetical protein